MAKILSNITISLCSVVFLDGFVWTVLHGRLVVWTGLFGQFCLDGFVWTVLFGRFCLDGFVWTVLFGQFCLDGFVC